MFYSFSRLKFFFFPPSPASVNSGTDKNFLSKKAVVEAKKNIHLQETGKKKFFSPNYRGKGGKGEREIDAKLTLFFVLRSRVVTVESLINV